jgi:hypothetical protein
MRSPDFIIRIAADSVAQLRRSDIERVLGTCSDEELAPTANYLNANRPDLKSKIEAELGYPLDERHNS